MLENPNRAVPCIIPLLTAGLLLTGLVCAGCDEATEAADSGAPAADQQLADRGADVGVDRGADQGVDISEYADWLESGDAWSCDVATLAAEASSKGLKILKGVSGTLKSTPLADIAKNPASFNGKLIQVEGVITEICSSQGCYIRIRGPAGNWLVLKVDDGTVDFRLKAKLGQYAIGEGTYISQGGHGPMVYIQKHGAVIGSSICKL